MNGRIPIFALTAAALLFAVRVQTAGAVDLAPSDVLVLNGELPGVGASDYVWIYDGGISGTGTILGSVVAISGGQYENWIGPGTLANGKEERGGLGTITVRGNLMLGTWTSNRAYIENRAWGIEATYMSSYFEISKSGTALASDRAIAGTLMYGGYLNIFLAPGSDASSTFEAGDEWNLFDFTTRYFDPYETNVFASSPDFGTGGGPGTSLPLLRDGLVWRFDYDTGVLSIGGSNGPDPVPEPSTLLLVGTGLLGLARLAARRRRAEGI